MTILDYQHQRTGSPSRRWIVGLVFLLGLLVLADSLLHWSTRGGDGPAYIEIEVLDDATGKPVPNAKLTPLPGSYFGFLAGNYTTKNTTDAAGRITFYMSIGAARGGGLFHTTTHYRSPSFEAAANGYITATVKVPPKNATTVFGIGASNHLKASVRLNAVKSNTAE